jgi:hypothetical protein
MNTRASEKLHNLDNMFSLQNSISGIQKQLVETQRQLLECRSKILDLERSNRMLEREVKQRLDHLESTCTNYDDQVDADDEDYEDYEDYGCDCGDDYCECDVNGEDYDEEGIVDDGTEDVKVVRRFQAI